MSSDHDRQPERASPTLRATQVSPVPVEAARGWEWRSSIVEQHNLDVAEAGVEQCIDDFKESLLFIFVYTFYCVAVILTAMGVVTGLVAWVKYSWYHV